MPLLSPLRVQAAIDVAALHGVLQRDASGAIVHCPLMLEPTSISTARLAELESLTEPFSLLSHRVASDLDFIAATLERVALTDDYTRFLLELARDDEPGTQDLRLAIVRSDYFMADAGLRQVELNTIAASYVGLAGRIAAFHRSWAAITEVGWSVVQNDPTTGVADAIAQAVRAYGSPRGCVLMVVQPGERNVFDQRILEVALAQREIPVVRCEIEALSERASLREGDLVIDGRVAAVTYFRAGYRPDELLSETAREARRMLARSASISVPDLATHLSGTKKIQQVLTDPAVLARFLDADDAARVARSFALIAGLDDPISVAGRTLPASEAALARPEEFVLKPQREGGGFNVYGQDIVRELQRMSADERSAFVLMERLHPPRRGALGLRAGQVWRDEVVSEIGHFGVLLACKDEVRLNRGVGYLVRTKVADHDEGGISAGHGHLDSLRTDDA